MGRLLGYTFCAVLSLMLLAAPIVVAGGGCINRNAANDGAIATVQIKDCSFAPTVTRVPVDTAVTWKNVDYLPHVISGVGQRPRLIATSRREPTRGARCRGGDTTEALRWVAYSAPRSAPSSRLCASAL